MWQICEFFQFNTKIDYNANIHNKLMMYFNLTCGFVIIQNKYLK